MKDWQIWYGPSFAYDLPATIFVAFGAIKGSPIESRRWRWSFNVTWGWTPTNWRIPFHLSIITPFWQYHFSNGL